MANYSDLTDEQLIRKFRDGDSEVIDYLMEKYKNLVRKEANAVYLLGGESDDLIQEGMIGLFKAVQDYDTEQENSFFSFAKLCVRRQLYSAVQAARRKKHGPLNTYVSLYEEYEGREALVDTVEASDKYNPEEILLSQEYAGILESKLEESLSDLEKRALYLHLKGTDYRTIAGLLHRSPKAIDNALQRVKAKTEKLLKKI